MFSGLSGSRAVIRLCTLVMLFVPAWGSCPAPTRTISICDLFRDLRACERQVVTVHGVLLSTFEFVALFDPECPHRFVTESDGRSVAWPVQLALELPSDQSVGEVSEGIRAKFELLRVPGRLLREHRLLAEARATITGKLELKSVYRQVNVDRGRPFGAGFGHLGAFPGRLQIYYIREFSVVFPNPR